MYRCCRWLWRWRRCTVFWPNKRPEWLESNTWRGGHTVYAPFSASWNRNYCCVCLQYWRLHPSGSTFSQVQLFIFMDECTQIKETKVHSSPHCVQKTIVWFDGCTGVASSPYRMWRRFVSCWTQQENSVGQCSKTITKCWLILATGNSLMTSFNQHKSL